MTNQSIIKHEYPKISAIGPMTFRLQPAIGNEWPEKPDHSSGPCEGKNGRKTSFQSCSIEVRNLGKNGKKAAIKQRDIKKMVEKGVML